MGRLKDWAYRPFHRSRGKGETVPDYVASSALGETLTQPVPVSRRAHSAVPAVSVDNGYWSGLMPRGQVAIDYTDFWTWNWATLLTGPATIIEKRVPPGQAWYIDNMYFMGLAWGGPGGVQPLVLPAASLFPWLIMTVFVSSSQLTYEAWQSLVVNAQDPIVSFPLLNDRIGCREAAFGVTLYEGEVIRAQVQARLVAGGTPFGHPPYTMAGMAFRFMGMLAPKADAVDYLEEKRWRR